jgi:phage baseplate assembly protein W
MPSSTGINAVTGKRLSDWDHVQQSIRKILDTAIGARIMRRDFGSLLPDMVDAKMTDRNILAIYSASAAAINKWEPRFRMQFGAVARAEATGVVALEITGAYYPNGHKGDYSVAEDRSTRIVFGNSL